MSQVRAWRSRNRVQTHVVGESMTDVSQQLHADVNYVVQRFARTGELPANRQGVYEDVTGLQMDLAERIRFAERVMEVAQAAAERDAAEAAVAASAVQAGQASSDVPAS